jgi:imidazolonepropionase
VTPGFIDAHTHLCFGGWRAEEFEQKLRGDSYLEIAQRGGGIASTVTDTRKASQETLKDRGQQFLNSMIKLGITTVEAKSGYGLTTYDEIKTLKAYKELNLNPGNEIIPTFLGAHIIPPEFKNNPDDYVDLLIEEMLPKVKEQNLARFVDIFVEESAFNHDQARRIMVKAKELGFGLKFHVDQLHDGNGAKLAAELGAVSADHLEYISDEGILAMKDKNVVPVSLPLASIYLNQPALPARKILKNGLPLALATDFNPGSAPSFNIQHAMWLGCVFQRMTPHEVLLGVTDYAARAIGQDHIGTIEHGKQADLLCLNLESMADWMYHYHKNPVEVVFKKGGLAWEK